MEVWGSRVVAQCKSFWLIREHEESVRVRDDLRYEGTGAGGA